MLHQLDADHSLVGLYVSQLRDNVLQKDALRFRYNLGRIGRIAAYEISKHLEFEKTEVTTPLGKSSAIQLVEQPILATILRAGLPLHQGFIDCFDQADSLFISANRTTKGLDEENYNVEIEYLSGPSIDNKVVILCDPMLATGSSLVRAYKALLQHGTPKQVHVMSIIASVEGLEYVRFNMPPHTHFWMAAIDDELTAHAFIVPVLVKLDPIIQIVV